MNSRLSFRVIYRHSFSGIQPGLHFGRDCSDAGVLNHSDWKKQKRVFVPLFLLGIVPLLHDCLHIVTWHMFVRGDDKHV